MAATAHPETYDCIVVGSGMGGLTVASLLAQVKGWKVLVLERHFKVGGFTHSFRRQRFEWDIGLHYVGAMKAGSLYRRIFDLVTQGLVKWQRLPEPFDTYVFPNFVFTQYSERDRFVADLKKQFPNEAKAIDQYFHDIQWVMIWAVLVQYSRVLRYPCQRLLGWLFKKYERTALTTLADYFHRAGMSQELQAVLGGQWGNYYLPPKDASFLIHAAIVDHYVDGGYYPVGGSGVIANSVQSVLQAHGGVVRVNHEVEEIMVRDGRAVGVRTRTSKGQVSEYYAHHIVSNAGARATYCKLLPESIPVSFRNELEQFDAGASNVALYLGLKESPEKLGFRGGNIWFFDSMDYDASWGNQDDLLAGKARLAYLSFPSLKDPGYRGLHTGVIIAPVKFDGFEPWALEKWKKRGPSYDALKETIAHALIDLVDRQIPGFRGLVAYHELSTPLTTEHFSGYERGIIYGLPARPERYRLEWLGTYTPVKNLYLTGADALCHGVVGALMSGFVTTAAILGWTGLFQLGAAMLQLSNRMRRSGLQTTS